MTRRMISHFLKYGGLQIKLILLLGMLKIYMSPWKLAMYGYYGIMHGATYGYYGTMHGATYGYHGNIYDGATYD